MTKYIFCPAKKSRPQKPIGVCDKCAKREKCAAYQKAVAATTLLKEEAPR